MSQFNLPDFTSPQPGGTFLKDNLEPWRDAVHSGHMGNTRPDYVVPGMWWIDNSTTPWVAKVFQGSDDIIIGTLDPTTLVFTPSAVDGSAVTGVLATNVTYDNAASGLTATNVQDASDELVTITNGDYRGYGVLTSGDVRDKMLEGKPFAIHGATSGFTNAPRANGANVGGVIEPLVDAAGTTSFFKFTPTLLDDLGQQQFCRHFDGTWTNWTTEDSSLIRVEAWRTAGDITTSTDPIVLNQRANDVYNCVDTSTGLITIPSNGAGWYSITRSMQAQSTPYINLLVEVNGVNIDDGLFVSAPANFNIMVSKTTSVYLAAGDVVKLTAIISSGALVGTYNRVLYISLTQLTRG